MSRTNVFSPATLPKDLIAGVVVFLVALPLCLGIALASNAPLVAGLVAGVVGGILVGALSGSHSSVAGPAAGLTAVVAAQIAALGSYEAFLVAVVLAGVIQVGMGVMRAGFLAGFVPSAVINGLLAAIGLILILKQIPHLVGHDPDPAGDDAFLQPDGQNTFSEIVAAAFDIQPGAAAVGLACLALLVVWDKVKVLRASPVPAPLVAVLLGVGGYHLCRALGGAWVIEPSHLVQVPVIESWDGLLGALKAPDWSALGRPAVYLAAATIAVVASLETLLNLEAVDKLDPARRVSPPNRELLAQGAGNVASGLLGGLPVTSVIVRSSVNLNSGAKTKLSAVWHGVLLAGCVLALPLLLNTIPLAALAAILMVTGYKLASYKIIRKMWKQGWVRFLPFAATVLGIVFTDLLIGIVIGLAVSGLFILFSSMKRPLRRVVEKHIGGEVLHIVLPTQLSFLSRAKLHQTFDDVPAGGHVLIDARETDHIDPDILDLIRTFENEEGPARGVKVSLVGFKPSYALDDRILYADYTSRELQDAVTPDQVLEILKDGNARFLSGDRLTRDLGRQRDATAGGQHPLAVILSCIDARTPSELIFDLGLGDIFSVRVAGNVVFDKVLGSMEYACKVAGAKLVLVVGHTRCGAVTAAVDLTLAGKTAMEATGCDHLDTIVEAVKPAIAADVLASAHGWTKDEKQAAADAVAAANVRRSVAVIRERSLALRGLEEDGRIKIIGCMYDIRTGQITFDV